MRQTDQKTLSKYTICALILMLASIIYWAAFAIHSYNTYHEYTDLGVYVYDMYYHVNYPGILHGMQYLVFGNHLAPDMMLFIPLYYLWQSSLCLLMIQVVAVSLTGFVLFLTAKRLLKSERTAFLLSLAFFLNPGVMGLLVFDFHVEMLIPLFMITTFYSFIERKKLLFAISTILLLGAEEITPFVAIALGVGLIIYLTYGYENTDQRKTMALMAISMIAVSVLALHLYVVAQSDLAISYKSNLYPNLPIFLKDIPFGLQQFYSIAAIGLGHGSGLSYLRYLPPYRTVLAFLMVFFGFGVAAILEPLIPLTIAAPWIIEVIFAGASGFVYIYNQYFGFVIGSSAVAALICTNLIGLGKKVPERRESRIREMVKPYVDHSILVASVLFFLISLYIIFSTNVQNLPQNLLLQTPPQQKLYYSQLDKIISDIPANASVMAPYFAMPHLANRMYFEVVPNSFQANGIATSNEIGSGQHQYDYWFNPQYIVTDPDNYIGALPITFIGFPDDINNSMAVSHGLNLSVYEQEGNATLWVNR